jgi:hypothetical protein
LVSENMKKADKLIKKLVNEDENDENMCKTGKY